MTTAGHCLFDTPIGRCGIAWSARGIAAVQLPETHDDATRARLWRRLPGVSEADPTREAQGAIEGIIALLGGEPRDLGGIALDCGGLPPFHCRVYAAAREIRPGETQSYGELAARIGAPGAARAVGQALGRNPFAIIVPCHRVLAAGGRTGGFSANGGVATKLRLLAIEGAATPQTLPLFAGGTRVAFDAANAVAHLRAADRTLARLIDQVGPFRMALQGATSVFAALTEAIVYQQLSGKAGATIHGRLCALFGAPGATPNPERLIRMSDTKLRGAGLSRAKVLALRDLAARSVEGHTPSLAAAAGMDDDAIIARLVEIRGVGRWTAEMFLMFRLGRPDVLPVDDYGIRKGYAIAFRRPELPTPGEVARRGERWRPYRTVASWYLWRASDAAAG